MALPDWKISRIVHPYYTVVVSSNVTTPPAAEAKEAPPASAGWLGQCLGNYLQLGFRLEIPDDHVLFLVHEDERIAVFSQAGARAEDIQKKCAWHMLAEHKSLSPGA